MLFSFCPYFLMGQLEIDFENGTLINWEQFPPDCWSICKENSLQGQHSLCHIFDNPENGTDRISLGMDALDKNSAFSFEFLLNYNYRPSASNNFAVYLMSEYPAFYMDGSQSNQALILGVNLLLSDDILTLYRQSDTKLESLCSTGFNWEEEVNQRNFRFLIEYSQDEKLTISGACEAEGMNLIAEMSIPGKELPAGNFFGIRYSYTATKDRLLKFDALNIKGVFLMDTLPPVLKEIDFLSGSEIHAIFNEDIYPTDNFSWSLDSEGGSVKFTGNKIRIKLDNELINGKQYHLILKNFRDMKMNPDEVERDILFYLPQKNDVIFSELMFDPTPPVYLPEADYIELYNRSAYPVRLKEWRIISGLKEWLLPDCFIEPESFMVISESDLFKNIPGNRFYKVEGSPNFLNNSGGDIYILNRMGDTIAGCRYDPNWYKDPFKSNGGWSVEKLDPENVCENRSNWDYSSGSEGGSPGYRSTPHIIYRDTEPPWLKPLTFLDSCSFQLNFTEGLSPEVTLTCDEMKSLSGLQSPSSISFSNIFHDQVVVKFDKPVTGSGNIYRWEKEVKDCNENRSYLNKPIIFGFPQLPEPMDVLFSEILFAPYTGSPEFIEIFNASEKIIALDELRVSFSSSGSNPISENALSKQKDCLYPGEYLCLCTQPDLLGEHYVIKSPGSLYEVTDLCHLADGGGKLLMHSRNGTLIDVVSFSADNHFSMLTDYHGVSLERIRFDKNLGSQSFWHSSSFMNGYATPGYKNSQMDDGGYSASTLNVASEIFSPDNDGINDMALFNYSLEKEGYVGSFRLFDASGRIIRILVNNELLGKEGYFAWDGEDGGGLPCSSGIYLGQLDVFHLDGGKKRYRETVVLERRGY